MEENKTTQPNTDQVVAENESTNSTQTSAETQQEVQPHQQELADVLSNINDDLNLPKDGLSQEEIEAKKQQLAIDARIQNNRKKTLGDNASRVLGNGVSRFAIVAVIASVAIGGGALMYLGGNDEQVQADLNGSIDLPKANVQGDPTLTPEQAEIERKNQQMQASNAQQNGETYIPSVIIERDADQQYLVGDGVVPGVKVEVDAQGRPVNNYGEAGFDPSLAHNGGATTSAADGTRGEPVNNFQNSSNTDQNVGQAQNMQPKTATVPQDQYASGMQALEQAGQNVENWQNGIAEHWLKKAAQTEETAQTAFIDQLNNLLSTKPKREANGVNSRYAQYSYAAKADKGSSDSKSSSNTSYSNQTVSGVNGGKSLANGNSVNASPQVYIRAGTSYVTQLISEVNTDEGAEVLARIASGPYKDAQIIGTVRQANKNIQFAFTRLIPKKGQELQIEAIARQVGTNKMGMADQVKTHTFKRYAGMVIASGMQGYGEAWSEIGTTTSNGYGGTTQTKEKPNDSEIGGRIVGQIGQNVSQDILKNTNNPTTYITYSGKVFNLYFNKNVTQESVAN